MTPLWHLEGPLPGASHASLEEALRLAHRAERRKPTDADARVSTFPPTPASREAVRLNKEKK